jgi:hypothetical protein
MSIRENANHGLFGIAKSVRDAILVNILVKTVVARFKLRIPRNNKLYNM